MKELVKCNKYDYPALLEIWERSVRATHTFLNENDIAEIKNALVPLYFPNVDLFAVKDDSGLVGFIGINENRIEMLFVDSCFRGCGYGSMMIDYAKKVGCCHVDVNEQNPHALEFYLKNGFHVVSRDDTDDCGRPFPILHLSL